MILNQYRKNLFQILDTFFNEIFYGGHYTALGSVLLIFSVSLILNIKSDLGIYVIAYLLSLIIYSFDYFKDLDKDLLLNLDRANYLNKKSKKFHKILLIYAALFLISLILFSNHNFILLIAGMILGGILYSKLVKNKTKNIPLLKNVYTALNWAVGGTFFIIIYSSLTISLPFLLMFIFIFLRVMINIIFFDLKDLDGDKNNGIKTLPVLFGRENTVLFLHFLNLASFLPLLWGIHTGFLPLFSISLLFFGFFVYYYIYKSQKATHKQLNLISYTMADSEFVIWPMVLLASQMIFAYL